MAEMSVFPRGTKTKPVFKSYEDYERYCRELYEEIRPEIEENRRRRARSEAIAMGLNPDSVIA